MLKRRWKWWAAELALAAILGLWWNLWGVSGVILLGVVPAYCEWLAAATRAHVEFSPADQARHEG